MNDDTNETDDEPTVPSVESDEFTLRRDWDRSVGISIAIVEAVAVATDQSAVDLPPLQHSLDQDALEVLLARDRGSQVTISFVYAGTVVTILENDVIEVEVDERSGDDRIRPTGPGDRR
ncbi:hypothetical protein JCM30237_25440 [Halolamina litorea]|uniref:HalOD1 output domain-containing protein n=1 Tax=Halolamina litorea TaxID=1515593 RepID=A0ABD6BU73_9EURY|nr:HalOD1 output domain-containing protein [Halolamina litorea]